MNDVKAKAKMMLALSLQVFPIIISAIIVVGQNDNELKKRLVDLFFEFFKELDTKGELGLSDHFTRKQFLKMAMSITETDDGITIHKNDYGVLEEEDINPLQNSSN